MYKNTRGAQRVLARRFVTRIAMLSYGFTETHCVGSGQHRKNIAFTNRDVSSERKKGKVTSTSQGLVIATGTCQSAENDLAQTSSSALKIPVSIQKAPASIQVITPAYGEPLRAQLNLTNTRIYDTNGTFSMRAEAPRSALSSLQVVS